MKFKNVIASLALTLCFLECSSAEEVKITEAWVMKQAFQKASEYARSISCEASTDEENLVALIPWRNLEDPTERFAARYALVWWGDIGCHGGTGTVIPGIVIVQLGAGYSFFVVPGASSPRIKFEVKARAPRVIKATENELTLSALDYAPNDPHCCPSISVQVRLREDGQGNWRLIEKTRTGP
jgi:hypothetical protein